MKHDDIPFCPSRAGGKAFAGSSKEARAKTKRRPLEAIGTATAATEEASCADKKKAGHRRDCGCVSSPFSRERLPRPSPGWHSGLAAQKRPSYRCGTAPEFHRTSPDSEESDMRGAVVDAPFSRVPVLLGRFRRQRQGHTNTGTPRCQTTGRGNPADQLSLLLRR